MSKTKSKSKVTSKTGMPPGSIVYIGSNIGQKGSIEVIDYDAESIQTKNIKSPKGCLSYLSSNKISWINVTGLSDVEFIKELGESFQFHRLLLEDLVNTKHRPKIDEYDNYIFIILKMLYYDDKDELVVEHLNLIMGSGYVVTVQEISGDVFEHIRVRLNNGNGRIRHKGSDYLMFAIIDAIVDYYYLIIEKVGEKIIALENRLFEGKDDETIVRDIQILKKEIIKIRRSIFPIREVISRLEKLDEHIIEAATQPYIKDLYDNTIQVIEAIDGFRDSANGLMDMHMNNLSNNMNKVMKVLTIIATMFIPLTFVAGVYGMNFEYIPELTWRYSYFAFWILMIVLIALMMYYFKKKKWF